jgi:hypothetical protein
MGINNLAVQTFSSTGSQSVCRANKADSSRQIKSDFISRPSVSYINGSGMSVINGTLTALPFSANNNSETFRIPNNIDAISDMVLSMDLNITKISDKTFKCGGIYYSKTFLLDLIDNIEIKMGGLVIQTIYPGDIYMRNYSELGHLLSQENSFNKIKGSAYLDTGSIIGHTTKSDEENISFSVSLPFIGRSSDKDRSFLQTGSFTKNLVVTVNYHLCIPGPTDTSPLKTYLDILPLLKTRGDSDTDTAVSISTKLCILSHIITDTEKNFIKQNIINRVINTSVGNQITRIQETYIKKATGVTSIEIDLDSVDLNVTHLLFCLNVNIFFQKDDDSTLPKQFLTSTNITPETLKSESEYVTGDNKLSSSWGKAGVDSNISTSTVKNPDVLGVFEGWLNSAELILGNETTGKIPCSALTSNQTEFKLMNVEENFYILKLADNAFSTAGVPFSRIKNKKLLLEVRNKFFNISTVTTPNAATQSDQGADTVIGTYSEYQKRDATINVCACGTTLQIINNNTISFSYI